MKFRLLKILADGRFHSGEKLGQQLGMSRTAVWKHIKSLDELDIDCYSVTGKGYRLAAPLELLDQTEIETALSEGARPLLSSLELHAEIKSTNRHLMGNIAGLSSGHVCLAERQVAGRGRRGRVWVSPFARNLYLSLYWRFQLTPPELSGLGLAVGVALIRALRKLGVDDAGLKWPNDVLWRGKKLAGILMEMQGEADGPYHVVIGVGLNIDMAENGDDIDQPWIDLKQITQRPSLRNEVIAETLSQLLEVLAEFQNTGLGSFIDEWHQADVFAGQQVAIYLPNETIEGQARGVDLSGALIVDTSDGQRLFHSGEISLRPLAQDAVS